MIYPHSNPFNFESPDVLLVKFTPYIVLNQSASNTTAQGIKKDRIGDEMIFLVPSSYQEDVVHQWENYESLGTAAVAKGATIVRQGSDLGTATVDEILRSGGGTAGVGSVVTKKFDTPMAFKDSNRRTLNLTFALADQGDTYKDVFEPVRKLQLYSCAEKANGFIDFDMPYIFTIESNSDMIYIENAALQSVQPTWFGPYRGGYPTKCELTVNIQDIQPLYRSSFKNTRGSR